MCLSTWLLIKDASGLITRHKNVPWIMSIFPQRQLEPIQGRSAIKIRTAIIKTITQSLFDETTSLPIGPCRKQVNLFAREVMWRLRKQPGKKAYLVKRIVIILYPAGIAFTGDAKDGRYYHCRNVSVLDTGTPAEKTTEKMPTATTTYHLLHRSSGSL